MILLKRFSSFLLAYLVRCGLVLQLKAAFVNVPYVRALWNSVDYDIEEANYDGIAAVPDLAAASAGASGADLDNPSHAGVEVVIDITALAGTAPTLTVIIEGKDPRSGKYYTILSSAALAAVATTVLQVYPGIAVTANLTASRALPRAWRVRYTIGGSAGQAVTAKISACKLR
jgi:hypothetical protein